MQGDLCLVRHADQIRILPPAVIVRSPGFLVRSLTVSQCDGCVAEDPLRLLDHVIWQRKVLLRIIMLLEWLVELWHFDHDLSVWLLLLGHD